MMEFTAEMIAGFLGGDIVGDKTVKVHTVSSIEEGKAGSMAYLVNPKYEPFLYTTEASIVLVDRSFTPQREVKPTLVKVDDAGAAVLRLLEMYNAARPQKKGVSERASISPEASLGEGCYVGDFAVIEAGARIGDGCRIYPQVYVGDGALSAPADIAVLGTPSNDIQRAFDEKIAALEEEFAKAGNDVQRDSLRKEYSKLMSDAVEMNRDNIYGVTTFLNNAYAFLSPEEVMEQIALFPAEWQQRRELTELREATERKLRVSAGHPYIDIAAKNADGGEVSLKSVVENRRNKYVLLDFWASWCGPCMAEIPFLKADYEKYGKKGFEIYAVSFDSQRDRWIDAVRQQGMKWIQVSDLSGFQTPAAEAYAVQSIPSNFLIRCSDGQIVATQLRGEALGEKLGELLGD